MIQPGLTTQSAAGAAGPGRGPRTALLGGDSANIAEGHSGAGIAVGLPLCRPSQRNRLGFIIFCFFLHYAPQKLFNSLKTEILWEEFSKYYRIVNTRKLIWLYFRFFLSLTRFGPGPH
jgi:hypothetical protein